MSIRCINQGLFHLYFIRSKMNNTIQTRRCICKGTRSFTLPGGNVYHRYMTFRIDLHVHSKFSGDTDSEPEESVLHAIRSGLQGIAFTEHYSFEASAFADALRDRYEGKIMVFRGVEFSSAEELKLPYTGGSDAHEPHEVGACYTEFRHDVTYDNFIGLLRGGDYTGVDTRKISRVWPF